MDKKENEENSEFGGLLDDEQQKSLYKMMDDMLKLAGDVATEYKEVDLSKELSDLSGSVVQISEDSPFLNEIFKGDSWKRVMSMNTLFNQTSGSKKDASE